MIREFEAADGPVASLMDEKYTNLPFRQRDYHIKRRELRCFLAKAAEYDKKISGISFFARCAVFTKKIFLRVRREVLPEKPEIVIACLFLFFTRISCILKSYRHYMHRCRRLSVPSDMDRDYMELALSLAERGRGATSPNPMVGAVVVRDGAVVGRGWHERAGGDHAEVGALREAGDKAIGATLYVTMEPCCHFGKTPPCTDAIIRSGVSRVVAAMTDPNPRVCGGGFFSLAERGIAVEAGLFEDRAKKLNEAYIKYIRTGIPFLTLKLAVTLDGRIAARDGTSRWITGPESRERVHRIRAWNDAVMVGSGTVIVDDPSLP